jgi:hypothetical protein
MESLWYVPYEQGTTKQNIKIHTKKRINVTSQFDAKLYEIHKILACIAEWHLHLIFPPGRNSPQNEDSVELIICRPSGQSMLPPTRCVVDFVTFVSPRSLH